MLFSVALALATVAQAPITLSVDLRDAPRKLYHSVEVIPVTPGPLTLAYPKWMPSEHAPAAIENHVGLHISSDDSGKQPIRWKRDAHDAYLYHLTVPQGVQAIRIESDFISAGSASADLAVLNWNNMLLYPYGGSHSKIDRIMVQPSITLPAGWRQATSLPAKGDGFATVTLEQLVDSPLIAGRHFREIEVAPRHYLDMVADSEADLAVTEAQVAQWRSMVEQSGYLFRSRHYNEFRFLMTLSDQVDGLAVDHHQSLDNRRPAKFLVDSGMRSLYGNFLPHDFVHSWNGKFRRPEGLYAAHFQQQPDTSGLWVYEGLTDYLGGVLTARAGIWTQQQYLAALAETAARYSHRPGRNWRDLQDTASMAMTLWQKGGGAYGSLRRDGFDFYGEGGLIWLDVDVTIRARSGGSKSLDDFIALFHGAGGDTPPQVRPYSMDELMAALNTVMPYDWHGFFAARLHALGPQAPLNGITAGGYRLVYGDTPSRGGNGLLYSIGMEVGQGGVVADVLEDGPAWRAGVAPGMKIELVNGQPYTIAALRQAIRAAQHEVAAIALGTTSGVMQLDYHEGERFPLLERIPGTPDLLGDIVRARSQ
jgi:predicted metalloprotease with PDZ domain